jgi:hypothetical protein
MLTPNHVANGARLAVAILVMLLPLAGANAMFVHVATAYFVAIGLLIGFPRVRSSDLTGAALLLIVTDTFAASFETGTVNGQMFLLTAAAVGAAILPFKAGRLRALASKNGYRSFADMRQHDRRRRSKPAPAAQTMTVHPVMPAVALLPAPSHAELTAAA